MIDHHNEVLCNDAVPHLHPLVVSDDLFLLMYDWRLPCAMNGMTTKSELLLLIDKPNSFITFG